MRLYDNDAYREEFMALVYGLLMSDGTNDRANQIIGAFDMAPAVEAEPSPPNDPLTLEQLREMDGEWVFCVSTVKEEDTAWGIVRTRKICPYVSTLRSKGEISTIFSLATYGSMWLAYRRKPEEGTA